MSSRSALIVANGEYRSAKLRKLRAPGRDADALARVLQDPAIGDFNVELVRDQPEHVLRRRIARFFADRRRDDLLLLHISCHGLKDDAGQLFFATVDTEFDDLDSTAVPEDFVRRQITKSRSGRIVLLLDCCYSGAFSRGLAARAGAGVELKERFAGRGRAVITASNAMEYSFEGNELSGEGEPSIFTCAVVKALETGQGDRDLDGWIAVDELYDYVYDEVSGASPQHPVKWVDLEGDLRIAKSVYRPPAKAAELAPDLSRAVESPERHTRLGAVLVLGDVLAGNDPSLDTAARQALERLAKDDSRLVSEAANRALASTPHDRSAGASMTATEEKQEAAVQSSAREGKLHETIERAPGGRIESPLDNEAAGDSLSAGKTDDAVAVPRDAQPPDRATIRPVDIPPAWQSGAVTATPVKPTTGPADSSVSVTEQPEPPVWPRNPSLAGDPRVGEELSLTKLSAPPGRVDLRYEWQRSLSDGTRSLTIQDAHDDRYKLRREDLGCRVRARITARTAFGEAIAESGWSAVVTTLTAVSPAPAPWTRLTGVLAAAALGVSGGLVVIASFFSDNPHRQALAFYRAPVAAMSVGVILLIGLAVRSGRRALLLASGGLALVLLGVAFPMSWPGPLPRAAGFWVGACGAAVAAIGAVFASWLAYRALPTSSEEARPTRPYTSRAAFAIVGPLIVVASLFVLHEWTNMGGTTWDNWNYSIRRYPLTIVVLCGVVIALAERGIRYDRRRLLFVAAAAACLVLGEAIPLIFPGVSDWGPGRWLRIVGAAFGVASLAMIAATARRDAAASPGDS